MQYLHAGSYVVASTWTKSWCPLSDYHIPMSLCLTLHEFSRSSCLCCRR